MRKCTFLITIIFIVSTFFSVSVNAEPFNPSLDIYSEAVYMVNINSGEVVYQKNENKPLHPASLSKIMTAILVLEHFEDNLDAMKTTYVSGTSVAYDDFVGINVSTADIKINEKVNYNDLLYALMLPSACEAANIIAYNLGEHNIASFVKQMNDKAEEIGATNTHFANAHGLSDPSQVTSARDMALITQYAMKFPKFMEIASTTNYTMEATDYHKTPTKINHTNAMLFSGSYYYEYAKGIKTGTLDEAGRCLISTASKNGEDYLLVTLNAPMTDSDGNYKFFNCIDHTTLYEWAFEKLSYQKILENKTEVGRVEVEYGKDANHVIVKPLEEFSTLWSADANPETSVKKITYLEDSVVAPVEAGQKLGTIDLVYNGDVIFTTDLVAVSSVERNNLKYKLNMAKQFKSSNMLKMAIFISLGIIVLYTVIFIVFKTKKGRRKTFKPKKIKKRR